MKAILPLFSLILFLGTSGTTWATDPQTDLSSDTLNFIDEANLKQGFWIFYGKDKKLAEYADDQKVEEGRYNDNRKSGIWKKYFATGTLKNEITYQNSRPNGYAKIYYENGQLKEEGIWKGNKWTGPYKMYHENGNVYHDFNFNPKGKREGTQRYVYENGQTMIEGDWLAGKESGVITEYYEDGSIKSTKNFEGGTLDASSVQHYEPPAEVEASIAEKKEAEAPKGDGIKAEPTEAPRTVNRFTGEGKAKLYNMSRQISKDGMFVNNKLMDGKWYRYDKNGILLRIEVYQNGAHVGDAPMPTE